VSLTATASILYQHLQTDVQNAVPIGSIVFCGTVQISKIMYQLFVGRRLVPLLIARKVSGITYANLSQDLVLSCPFQVYFARFVEDMVDRNLLHAHVVGARALTIIVSVNARTAR
jgi:hypothetical protein